MILIKIEVANRSRYEKCVAKTTTPRELIRMNIGLRIKPNPYYVSPLRIRQ